MPALTLARSLTLATLGFVRFPSRAVEAVIALSMGLRPGGWQT